MQQFPTVAKVGLDVHATQTHVAVLDPATGEVWTRRLQGPPLVALVLPASAGSISGSSLQASCRAVQATGSRLTAGTRSGSRA